MMLNLLLKPLEIISSATIKPGTFYNDMLYLTFKDNAPNPTSVGQIRDLFFLDAIMDLGCFDHWLRTYTCE